MNLREYIDKTGIPITRLADRCGLSFHQVYHILNGKEPKLRSAIRISRYTKFNPYGDQWVEPWELLPSQIAVKIKEEIKKKK